MPIYPALMAYIESRSAGTQGVAWTDELRLDEQEAHNGGFADVAADLELARADYAHNQRAKGESGYPYNNAMAEYLGLPLRDGKEPPVGYHMALHVMNRFRLGNAEREIKQLLSNDKAVLRIVAARSLDSGKPLRFYTFHRNQIHLDGREVVCNNGRVRVTLSSDKSIQTVYERVAEALRNGLHYGYHPISDGPASDYAEVLAPSLFERDPI
jgi:hypothetical protein